MYIYISTLCTGYYQKEPYIKLLEIIILRKGGVVMD